MNRIQYRGRVRTGCLTCRARKVRCDEARPECHNCTRLLKTCNYPGRDAAPARTSLSPNTESQASQLSERALGARQSHHLPPDDANGPHAPDWISGFDHGLQSRSAGARPARTCSLVDCRGICNDRVPGRPGNESDTDSTPNSVGEPDPEMDYWRTAQDIYVTTTLDRTSSNHAFTRPPFSYFLEQVKPALIVPYDHVNWNRLQHIVVDLAAENEAMACAILAVQELYKAQFNAIPTVRAMDLYHAAKNEFGTSLMEAVTNAGNNLDHTANSFETTLLIAFILSLFEMLLPDMTDSVLQKSDGEFLIRLQEWVSNNRNSSPVSLRVEAWFRMLHLAAWRGGGPGLLSPEVSNALASSSSGVGKLLEIPSLVIAKAQSNQELALYDRVSAPIFQFYQEVMGISTCITSQSHYHRSRKTADDQKEVVGFFDAIKTDLSILWDGRPGLMRLRPSQIRSSFPHSVAEPLIRLIGICSAQYFTEIIEIGRNLSDPPLAGPESKHAMWHIRDIIESSEEGRGRPAEGWNAFEEGRLSPAFIRPLFTYSCESMDRADLTWAAAKLGQVQDPICKSNFVASLAQALGVAQIMVSRRVTSRFFCEREFGVPPPYM